MLAKRIIPCLDVHAGRVVKGINFINLRDAGDPVELAAYYDKEGADELVFLDITASSDGRRTMIDVVRNTARKVFIPFAVGGGIRSLDDIRAILNAGADKVSINSAAVHDPSIIKEAALRFGRQCIVVAIDARRRQAPQDGPDGETDKRAGNRTANGVGTAAFDAAECGAGNAEFDGTGNGAGDGAGRGTGNTAPASLKNGAGKGAPQWEVFINGGRTPTGLDVLAWARKVEKLGAGEILLTSMDKDGTKDGYDLELTAAVADMLPIPVIASGGAGNLEHLYEACVGGKADAVLSASIFHYKEYTIAQAKAYLAGKGVAIRK